MIRLKLQYLGTAAAEAFPGVFCHCETCQKARKLGGKNIRRRSGMVVNDTTLIDFPPDIYALSLEFGLDLGSVTDLVVTHSHEDHFDVDELSMRQNGLFCHLGEDAPPLRVHGNDGVERSLKKAGMDTRPYLDFSPLTYFEPLRLPNGLVFTPLPASHAKGENACIFLVEDGSRRILYAHDTGLFPEEDYPFLQGKSLDFVSFDCCNGSGSGGFYGHMGMPECRQVAARLRAEGCIRPDTRLVLNHFSHTCGDLHEELEAKAAKDGFEVAYDGMIVTL